jgi:hypothetical protein
MIGLGLILRIIAFIAMALISNPKRPTINLISKVKKSAINKEKPQSSSTL